MRKVQNSDERNQRIKKWRDGLCSWVERAGTAKVSDLLYLIHGVNAIKIPASCFVDINKWILKFLWSSERPSIANTGLKKKRAGGLALPDWKTYY